jgi:membrane-bound lytic murein transglycosylase B
MMKRVTRAPARRRPQHARPSLLAPTRSLAAGSGLAAFIGLAIAGCAAVAGGDAGVAARAAIHPAAPPAVQAFGAKAQAGSGQLTSGAADIAAMGGSASAPAGIGIGTGNGPAAVGRPNLTPASGLAASGIPATALAAYKNAAAREAARKPACGIAWPLLAGIGRVESNHGRFAGATLHSDGLSTPPVVGIPLNGSGTALIRDTDGGRLDHDTVYDRAVGPMQFIPSTWASWGVDANHDGIKDPFNVFDAAAAAADYLCAAGRDLTTSRGQVAAILSYNYSYDYVSMVMALERVYASGVGLTVPVLPTTPGTSHGPPTHRPSLPPVDPGKPRGIPPPKPPKPPKSSSSHTPAPHTSSSSSSSSTTPAPTCSSSGSSASSSSSASGSGSASGSSSAGSSASTPSCSGSSSSGGGTSSGSSSSATSANPAADTSSTAGTGGPTSGAAPSSASAASGGSS